MTKLIVAALMLFSIPSYADHHPRRAQVEYRLANEHARIRAGARQGQLTPREAYRLRREARSIRAQERAFASRHGGHITRHEQRVLNRRENRLSRHIRHERHD
jgi:hypothetical protein